MKKAGKKTGARAGPRAERPARLQPRADTAHGESAWYFSALDETTEAQLAIIVREATS